jgi:MSHA biogenesis protein MshO
MRPTASEQPAFPITAGRHRQDGRHRLPHLRGFTLVEMIISIVLISILAMVAAPLLRMPMLAWMDVSRRARLASDIDMVHSKLNEDLRSALPGSVRRTTVGGRVLLEYLEVRAQGRYRNTASGGAQICPATCAGAGNNDLLQSSCTETCFTSLSPLQGTTPLVNDWVVVNPTVGNPYQGGNVATPPGIKTRLTGFSAAPSPNAVRINIAGKNFPSLPASNRFYIVSTPVTYDCNPATGQLTRRWGYPISQAQPVAFGANASSALLATNVTVCDIPSPQPQIVPTSGRQVVSVHLRLSQMAADAQASENADLVASFAVGEDL